MGTLEPVPDCAVVVGGELEQSLEEERRTGASSDIVKVKRLGPTQLFRRYNKIKPRPNQKIKKIKQSRNFLIGSGLY